jgi:Fe-S-cluster containining protein
MGDSDYLALRAKVDAFGAATTERRQADLRCRAGCTACCEVHLEVSEVEARYVRDALAALDVPARSRLAERAGHPSRRCVMLEGDGRCAIYEARPLVCRTQGHALRYPPGTLPESAVRATGASAEVTWCPLNYTEQGPAAEDVLDAERVDVLLALVNRRVTDRPLERVSLVALALEGASRDPERR